MGSEQGYWRCFADVTVTGSGGSRPSDKGRRSHPDPEIRGGGGAS